MFERVIAYEAWCDHDGCSEGTQMYLPPKFDTGRMAQARKQAREEGWWIGPKDEALCPRHKPADDHRPDPDPDPYQLPDPGLAGDRPM